MFIMTNKMKKADLYKLPKDMLIKIICDLQEDINQDIQKKKDELIEHYVKRMVKHQKYHDTEDAHFGADEDLCILLRELGFEKVVEKYVEVDKWYG